MKRYTFSTNKLNPNAMYGAGELIEFRIANDGKVSAYAWGCDIRGQWKWYKLERSFSNEELSAAVVALKQEAS